MSGRIQPDRVGYDGYDCDPSQVPLYVLPCICCTLDDPLCANEYGNIPVRPSVSAIFSEWDKDHAGCVLIGPPIPDTDRHIWIVTEGLTPADCEPQLGSRYNYLRTEYIDVPPIRTRGLSLSYKTTPAGPTITTYLCFDISESEPAEVFYLDEGCDRVVQERMDDGGYGPVVVPVSQVCSSYDLEPGSALVMFSYCKPDETLSLCYEVRRTSPNEEVVAVYYLDEEDNEVSIPRDSDGFWPPTTVPVEEVSSSYLAGISSYVTFSFCPRDYVAHMDSDCTPLMMITVEDGDNDSFVVKWNYKNIPGYSASGKYGLIIDDGCPRWLEMAECPSE